MGKALVVLADGFCHEIHNRCEILMDIIGAAKYMDMSSATMSLK